MNKYILSVVFLSSFALATPTKFEIFNSLTKEQKVALQEYVQKQQEKNADKAKRLLEIIIKVCPDYTVLLPVSATSEDVLYTIESFCESEELIFWIFKKHPELWCLLEDYYDEDNCKMLYDEEFSTVYSWDQFKIIYASAIVTILHDKNFEKHFTEKAFIELTHFADYLISKKNSN